MMDMQEYDVILGTDRLTQHSTIIVYAKKRVLVECLGQSLCPMQRVRLGKLKFMISAMKAHHSLVKYCVGYLASVVISSSSTLRVQDIPIVCGQYNTYTTSKH